MAEWNTHNCEVLPEATRREIDVELAAADRAREAKSLTAKRLTALEKRCTAIEQHAVSHKQLDEHIDMALESVGHAMGTFVRDELAELEQRVTGKAIVKDKGIWRDTETYVPGELVSDKGAAWLCKSTTMDRPGESGDWRCVA